ncbi:phage major tail tube protein [Escherichia coli]|jgi:P2 family phage contractile tail tube protein|uniref:Phage major tail tube protein n=3 Tax=Escherichia coli TaxID=562 RepID=A0A5P0JBS7_ECOLX|nr:MULTISPECIES: phage major tail tube protein [Enterobacteriaceae]EFA8745491.1 phage major tail tube protein [Escherichia coli O117]EFB4389384.1 phage major tail tube protein [Escherichia coli]EFL8226696.1 phage major tail tube protein [Escherichia coli]EFN9862930.1 phage major tail tube protein [Escherichia coli]EFO1636384.1 phage major tail tube protein [Escherichia coli]
MAIPAKLRLFTCFVNGTNNIGKVTSVTLPKLTRKTEDYQGGGMIGSVAVDLGLDSGALDATMVVGGLVKELLLEYGNDIDGTTLRFTGEYYTSGESLLVDVEMRGQFTEIDGGESKQGEDTSVTYAVKNTYYKLSIDDKPVWEIDLINFVYKRDGKNIYPDRVTSALGLGS